MLIQLKRDHPKYREAPGLEISALEPDCLNRRCFRLVVDRVFNHETGHPFRDAYCKRYRARKCPSPPPPPFTKKPEIIKILRKVPWRGQKTFPLVGWIAPDKIAMLDQACDTLKCTRVMVLYLMIELLDESQLENWQKETDSMLQWATKSRSKRH